MGELFPKEQPHTHTGGCSPKEHPHNHMGGCSPEEHPLTTRGAVPPRGTHITTWGAVPPRGTHITTQGAVPPRGTHITTRGAVPPRGTHWSTADGPLSSAAGSGKSQWAAGPPEAPGTPFAPPWTLAPVAGSPPPQLTGASFPALSRLPGTSPPGPSCSTSQSRLGPLHPSLTASQPATSAAIPLRVPGSGRTSPPSQAVGPAALPRAQLPRPWGQSGPPFQGGPCFRGALTTLLSAFLSPPSYEAPCVTDRLLVLEAGAAGDQAVHGPFLSRARLTTTTDFVVAQSLSRVDHGLPHARFPCPSLSPRVCSNSRPLSW